AFGKRTGSVTITASASGLKGTTTLTVSNGTLVSLAITPANSIASNGSKQQFTATGTFSDSTTQDITLNVHWSSSSASVATIANAPSTAGLAAAAGVGSTTLGAHSGGIMNHTRLTVQSTTAPQRRPGSGVRPPEFEEKIREHGRAPFLSLSGRLAI